MCKQSVTTNTLVVTNYTALNGTVLINGTTYVPGTNIQGTSNQINVVTAPTPSALVGDPAVTTIGLANAIFAPGSLGAKTFGCVGCESAPANTADGDFTARNLYSSNASLTVRSLQVSGVLLETTI